MKNLLTLLLLAGMASAQTPKDIFISERYGESWQETSNFKENAYRGDSTRISNLSKVYGGYMKGVFKLEVQTYNIKGVRLKLESNHLYFFDTTGEQKMDFEGGKYQSSFYDFEFDKYHDVDVSYDKEDGLEVAYGVRNPVDSTYEYYNYKNQKLDFKKIYNQKKGKWSCMTFDYKGKSPKLIAKDTSYISNDTSIFINYRLNEKENSFDMYGLYKSWKSNKLRYNYYLSKDYRTLTFRKSELKATNDSNDIVLTEIRYYKDYWIRRTTYDYAANMAVDSTFDEKSELLFTSTRLVTTACGPNKQNQNLEYASAKGSKGTSTLRYDEGQDCRTRIVELQGKKGRITRIVTSLDSQDRPVLSQTFNYKNELTQKTIYTYTDY